MEFGLGPVRIGISRRRSPATETVAVPPPTEPIPVPAAPDPVALPPVKPPTPGMLYYRCNVCGNPCQTQVMMLNREAPSCKQCGSNVRMRAIVHWLSSELFGESIALPDFPQREDLRGLGMSCWDGYAVPLAQKLSYTNTYYHQEPKLDLRHPPSDWEGQFDFMISSDVFEHIEPPVSIAFDNVAKLLKPAGMVIFTVPYDINAPTFRTKEHFPELYDYEILNEGDRYWLKNITRDGQEQIFEDLVFHGGPGLNLEMRMFSESDLLKAFQRTGFEVKICREPAFQWGIYWSHTGSLPMVARRRNA